MTFNFNVHADAFSIFTADPSVNAVAYWLDSDGSSYVWPSALVDNRRSRVLARINRFCMDIDPATLIIVNHR